MLIAVNYACEIVIVISTMGVGLLSAVVDAGFWLADGGVQLLTVSNELISRLVVISYFLAWKWLELVR